MTILYFRPRAAMMDQLTGQLVEALAAFAESQPTPSHRPDPYPNKPVACQQTLAWIERCKCCKHGRRDG